MLHCTEEVKKALTDKCPSVDFDDLPEFVMTKAEMNDYVTHHKKAGVRGKGVKKQEREDAIKIFTDNASEISADAITQLRKKKRETLAAIYPEGDIKLFVAKNWTLEYEIAKSGLFKELAMAVCMAKGEQAGKTVSKAEAKNEVDEKFKEGTNDAVAYEIFKPINDGAVSKAIVAQYLAEILEDNVLDSKVIFESDENLVYLKNAIEHVTPKRA